MEHGEKEGGEPLRKGGMREGGGEKRKGGECEEGGGAEREGCVRERVKGRRRRMRRG